MTIFTIVHFNMPERSDKCPWGTKDISHHNKQLDNFVSLTKLPSIAKSVSYFEPRYLEYKDYSYTLYPELKTPSYMKFAYE